MRLYILIFLFATSPLTIFSQSAATPSLYFVGFVDKAGSPASINEAATFLSERALMRRERNGSPVTQLDLPVSKTYESETIATGAKLWLRSKWMNGLIVAATKDQLASINTLPFVDTTIYAAPYQHPRESPLPPKIDLDRPAPVVQSVPVNEQFYGYGYRNLQRMNGDSLHRMGYRGRGVLVAVFDGGFPNVAYKDFLGYDQQSAVPANYDLVEQDSTALDGSTHGATVVSTMAAHHPFFYIGMAPEARYVLFKTEDSAGEHRMEEFNYAIALEMADSIGVDVVNSSLGYTTFSDSSMDYTYADLDGQTSPASRAIDHAFARGMIVVTSAGNNGADEWHYLGIPADARGAFSIGALGDNTDEAAYFSSHGPTPDGRTKPDVSGPGVNVPAVAANGQGLTGANGTSLSSPQVAALVACLVQAVPRATNLQILDAIRNTASRNGAPDDTVGYGLPDFAAALRYLNERSR